VPAFDEKVGLIWARLIAEGTAKGRPRSALDTIIAAIAEANECIVVAHNKKDFADIEIVNPLGERGWRVIKQYLGRWPSAAIEYLRESRLFYC